MNYEFRIGQWLIILLVLIVGCNKDEPAGDYPTDGLVSYYSFDGNYDDIIGNSPTGVAHGSPEQLEGYRGESVMFDGVEDYMTINRSSYQKNNQYSVAFWFRAPSATDPITMLHCQDFRFVANPSRVWHHAQTMSTAFSPRGPYLEFNRTHVVGVYDGIHSYIYVNGILYGVQYDGTPLTPGVQDLTLALYDNDFWRGQLDELFLYNRPLRQIDVTHLFER